MTPRATALSLASLVALLAGRAAAQVPSIDARSFRPSTDPAGSFYLEPPATPGPWQANVAALGSWAYRPAVLRDADGSTTAVLVSQQPALDALANVGLGSRFALGLHVPALLGQTGDANDTTRAATGGGSLPAFALGDPAITAKASLLRPASDLGGFALGVLARATVPVGSRASYAGEGAATFEPRALAEYRLVALAIEATAGFHARTATRDVLDRTYANEVPWGAAVVLKPQALGIDEKGRWAWTAEVHGAIALPPPGDARDRGQRTAVSPVLAGLHARYALGDASLVFGVEGGVTQALGLPPLRAIVGVAWAPRSHDRDHDGVDDDVDECPDLPEDRDGFQDQDGCPEDNDDDGVPDAQDRCPNEKENGDDFDGCPDPDTDGDGVLDPKDACPRVPGLPSDDPAKNGCPLPRKPKPADPAPAAPTDATPPQGAAPAPAPSPPGPPAPSPPSTAAPAPPASPPAIGPAPTPP